MDIWGQQGFCNIFKLWQCQKGLYDQFELKEHKYRSKTWKIPSGSTSILKQHIGRVYSDICKFKEDNAGIFMRLMLQLKYASGWHPGGFNLTTVLLCSSAMSKSYESRIHCSCTYIRVVFSLKICVVQCFAMVDEKFSVKRCELHRL